MKYILPFLAFFLCYSCIPLRIAPKIEKDKVMLAKKFKRHLPKRYAFIFEDNKKANEFYYYVDTKDLYRNNLPVATCSFACLLRLPLPVGRLKILVIATAMPAFFALWSNKITAYNSVTLFLNRS